MQTVVDILPHFYVSFFISLPQRVLLCTFVNISGIYKEVSSCKSPPYVCVLLTFKNFRCTVGSPDHT